MSSGVFCTQCEAEGFRRITYFPDRPDVLARYTVTLRADRERYPGAAVERQPGRRRRRSPTAATSRRWHDPFPKPSYLFALVAGDLAALEDTLHDALRPRSVALAIYSTPAQPRRAAATRWRRCKRAMRWDEERFGREYDLDTLHDLLRRRLQHGRDGEQGPQHLQQPARARAIRTTATDDDYEAIEGVIGHEYFHNWTGNRVTCRDWFQLSLKEGPDRLPRPGVLERPAARAPSSASPRSSSCARDQFPEDAGPMAHPVRPDEYIEINNFYTTTVYEKGAEVIRMQHTLLGPERFRRGMDLYFERHDGQAVTCDDFVQAMQDAVAALDLAQFRRWYAQAGTPVAARARPLRRRGAHATRSTSRSTRRRRPASRTRRRSTSRSRSACSAPTGATCRCASPARRRPARTTRVLDLTRGARRRFRFVDVAGAAGAVAAARLLGAGARSSSTTRDRRARVPRRARQRPRQSLGRGAAQLRAPRCCGSRAQHRARRAAGARRPVAAVVAHAARRRRQRPGAARAGAHPARSRPTSPALDRDASTSTRIVAAREFVIRELARALRGRVRGAVARRAAARALRADAGADRPARARATAACATSARSTTRPRARSPIAQYDAADNMTDAIAALAARQRQRRRRSATRCSRASRRTGATSRWCSTSGSRSQATSQRADTLARVRSLLAHPRFNARNPNRVRSLVGAFALRNWRAFHAPDGAATRSSPTRCWRSTAANPQLAVDARRRVQPVEALRRAAPRADAGALERIAAMRGCRPTSREIVRRTLDD